MDTCRFTIRAGVHTAHPHSASYTNVTIFMIPRKQRLRIYPRISCRGSTSKHRTLCSGSNFSASIPCNRPAFVGDKHGNSVRGGDLCPESTATSRSIKCTQLATHAASPEPSRRSPRVLYQFVVPIFMKIPLTLVPIDATRRKHTGQEHPASDPSKYVTESKATVTGMKLTSTM